MSIFSGEDQNIYNSLGRTSEAIDYFDEAYRINDAISNWAGKARNLCHLGLAYWSIHKTELAYSLFLKGTILTMKATGQRRGVGLRLAQLGSMLGRLRDSRKGIQFIHSGIAKSQVYSDHRSHVRSLLLLSSLYILRDDYRAALLSLRNALCISNDHNYGDLGIEVRLKLGEVLCDYLRNYSEGYKHYSDAYNLHLMTWDELIRVMPSIEPLNNVEECVPSYL